MSLNGAYLGEEWCDEDEEDIVQKEKNQQHHTRLQSKEAVAYISFIFQFLFH